MSGLRWMLLALVLLGICPALPADTRDRLDDPPPSAEDAAAKAREELQPEVRAEVEKTLRPELEAEYRKELENRLAQERDSYAASLENLWMSNAAVWGCLLLFVALQALSARKRMQEIARLKALRDNDPDR